MKVSVLITSLFLTLLMTITNCGYTAVYNPGEYTGNNDSEYDECHLVKARMLNGKFIAVVDLPEIEISAEKDESLLDNKDTSIDEVIGTINLPLIEIVNYFDRSDPEIAFLFFQEYIHTINLRIINTIPAINLKEKVFIYPAIII